MFAGSVNIEFEEDKIRLSGFLVPGYTLEQEEISLCGLRKRNWILESGRMEMVL